MKEIAVENKNLLANRELLDDELDLLEVELQSQLDENIDALQNLVNEEELIKNPDNLGSTIMNVVWEQFLNQVAVTAGEDFIKENRNLKLDLRTDAHIQTTENFKNGKIANHNTHIDYQERYDTWQDNFQKDEAGKIRYYESRSGKREEILKIGARKEFDQNRPKGSIEKGTDMDHTLSAGEIIRDAEANTHLSRADQLAFANSNVNLNEMDAKLNRSKGDKSMSEWLDNPNSKGQKPSEIFDITSEEEAKLREIDRKARNNFKQKKVEGEQRSKELGRQSQIDESKRIGNHVLRTIVMGLLTDLVKEIFSAIIKWLKSSEHSIKNLLSSLKTAISSFVKGLKNHLVNSINLSIKTVLDAIFGPIYRTIQKVWDGLKQGWKIIKQLIDYNGDIKNKNKSMTQKITDIIEIVTVGVTAIGAVALGTSIESVLMGLPGMAIEIPFLGSLASILGIFFGAVIAGVLGAIVLHWVKKFIAKKLERENREKQIEKGNEILALQHQAKLVGELKMLHIKSSKSKNIQERHAVAGQEMFQMAENISRNSESDKDIDAILDDIDLLLNE